ncbi:MAG: DUF2254 domain-containing protein [Nitrolancea sp.]
MPNLSVDRLQTIWQNARSSLWFLPASLGILAIVLSWLVSDLDHHLPRQIALHRGWLFYGSPDAARTLLSTLAGSLITVISLLFSITMLTMQQASSQYTSRILRNFTDHRGVQWVLGVYIATFMYCVLVLRQVRSSTDQASNFVPALSISLAILLAVICVALLVYYVHLIATMLQAATVVERVHDGLIHAIDHNYPADRAEGTDEDRPLDEVRRLARRSGGLRIHSEGSGFLRSVDENTILKAIPDGSWAITELALGQYVLSDAVLLESSNNIDDPDRVRRIRNAFILDRQRSLPQDTLFGVRQLVDIAVRALSPGINDPTTAEHAISCLTDGLIRLGDRPFPPRVTRGPESDGCGSSIIWVDRPNFARFVDSAYAQIRRAARNDVDVTLHLLKMMRMLAAHVPASRAEPVWEQIARTVSQIRQSSFTPEDRTMLFEVANDGARSSLDQ